MYILLQNDRMYTCEECLNSFWRFFNFKQRIGRNLQLLDTKLFSNVKHFVISVKENVVLMDFMKCLILVPISKEHMLNDLINSNAFSEMSTESYAPQELKTCRKVEKETELDSDNNQNGNLEQVSKKERKPEHKRLNHGLNVNIKRDTTRKKRKRRNTTKTEHDKGCGKNDKRKNPKQHGNSSHYDLSMEETIWLRKEISKSRRGANSYKCTQCHKNLSSFHSIRYHLTSQHIVPRDPSKIWIREKIQQGKQLVKQGKLRKFVWNCVYCLRIFNNEPALRYHLYTHHLGTDETIEDVNDTKPVKLEQ